MTRRAPKNSKKRNELKPRRGTWSLAVCQVVAFLSIGLLGMSGLSFAQTFEVVRSLAHSPNGERPTAGLIQASNGTFYGTTSSGGTGGGYGTVFKMDAGSKTFSFESPIVLQSDTILPSAPSMFEGASFQVNGGTDNYGIATIDPNLANGTPVNQITSQLSKSQYNTIRGKGGTPSVGDITADLTGDGLNLLNPGYLWSFVQYDVPTFAHGVYQGNQSWSGNSQPYVGFFDPTKEATDPVQDPKITYVNGDLSLGEGFNGGGLLVVTGKLSGNGSITWNGLIFVIGKGDVNFSGMNVSMTGGLYVVNVQPDANAVPQFGTVKFTMAGQSNFSVDADTTKMKTVIIPGTLTTLHSFTGSQGLEFSLQAAEPGFSPQALRSTAFPIRMVVCAAPGDPLRSSHLRG